MDELRKRLRQEARTHTPDRARILARVERGMAGQGAAPAPSRSRGPASWLRVAAVTAAAVTALGACTYVLVAATEGGGPQTVATTPEPARRPVPPPVSSDAPERPSQSRTPEERRPSVPPESGTPAAPGTPAGPRDGYLRSDGVVDPNSNSFWAQNNVTLTTERPLTSLTVELRVAQTGGVRATGSWHSLPEEDFTTTVRPADDGTLVYRWTLKDGVTVPAGEHVFAGRYDHGEGGRDAGDDRYRATAAGSGRTAEVGGDFG
ncbi:hypothetical protein ACIOWG_24285 [Streptomyces sp. NPDC087658]|uniref:hypothetical protein n=1 Tax=Streptomyces sp. NPDC087658 TaxID=3365800 RepID=UPI00380688CC